MIEEMVGKVERVEGNKLFLRVYGIIYGIHITATFANVLKDKIMDHIKIYCIKIIGDNYEKLYGFLIPADKSLFNELLKVRGVGPSAALKIVCEVAQPGPDEMNLDNIYYELLIRIKGVGKETARKIIEHFEKITGGKK